MGTTWRQHPQFGHVALCDGPEGLAAIYEPHINLVIWEKAFPRDLQAMMLDGPAAELPCGIHWASAPSGWAPGALAREFCDHPRPWHEPFFSLAARLCGRVSELSSAERLLIDFRLEPPYTDAEAGRVMGDVVHFHRDTVAFRLLMPICGLTTEWVPDGVPLQAFGADGGHYRAPVDAVQYLPSRCVALFRGVNGSRGARGLVHRSPQSSRLVRSMLVITP